MYNRLQHYQRSITRLPPMTVMMMKGWLKKKKYRERFVENPVNEELLYYVYLLALPIRLPLRSLFISTTYLNELQTASRHLHRLFNNNRYSICIHNSSSTDWLVVFAFSLGKFWSDYNWELTGGSLSVFSRQINFISHCVFVCVAPILITKRISL